MAAGATPGYSSETYVGLLYDYLDAQGYDSVAVLGEARPAASADGLARYPVSRHAALFERAVAATGDEALALKVGASIRPEHYGVLGFVVMACPNLGEALERAQRFERLVNDANRVHLQVDGAQLRMEWGHEGFSPGRHMDEMAIGALVSFTRQITNRDWNPSTVAFRHGDPQLPEAYEQVFACPVQFSQNLTMVSFPAHYLQAPLVSPNPGLRTLLDRQAEQILARDRESADAWERTLYKAVHGALTDGEPTLEAIAGKLHVSPRTLQRRLSERQGTFQSLLDTVRQQMAQHYLEDRRLQLADVALLLGYSEQSAFNRAFKRWTRQTPRQWRQAEELRVAPS